MWKGVIFMIFFFLLACGQNKSSTDHTGKISDDVYAVKSEDSEMNDSIAKAISTYPEFLKKYIHHDSDMTDFSVKFRFAYGEGNGEHMWLNDLHYRNDKLCGVLDSDPVNVFRVKTGDTIEVVNDSISDWMYLKKNKLIGGYTIRAVYNKMTEKEKEEFKKQVGFEIE